MRRTFIHANPVAMTEESHMVQIIPETMPDFDRSRVIERPNGFFWNSTDDNIDHGPFETLLAAVLDMQQDNESTPEPGETLEQAEAEIGLADWIDPDTGEPAEAQRPHLEEH